MVSLVGGAAAMFTYTVAELKALNFDHPSPKQYIRHRVTFIYCNQPATGDVSGPQAYAHAP